MSKFRQGSHKLKTNQKIYFGTNNYAYAYFDGTDLIITTTSGNINLSPGGSGNVVLDRQIFPNTEGTIGYGLSTDGAGTLSWIEGEAPTPPSVGDIGVFGGGESSIHDTIDFITISSATNASDFGNLTADRSGISACSNGYTGRGVFMGGEEGSQVNTIEYITITSTSNSTNFGDLTETIDNSGGTSNGTNDRGVRMAGYGSGDTSNVIDYITISSAGDSTNFGDLTTEARFCAGTSNGIGNRGINAGGRAYSGSWANVNIIDYFTISTPANADDFGDLSAARYGIATVSNGTNNRAVFCGGREGGNVDTMEYVTITSTSNTTDFGDLTAATYVLGGTSNTTNERGVIGGGNDGSPTNTIEYITISTPSAATNFGDLTVARQRISATSNA